MPTLCHLTGAKMKPDQLCDGQNIWPSIMGDAAHAILSRDASACTGNFFIDEEVLVAEGVTDFDSYAVDPTKELCPDFFV